MEELKANPNRDGMGTVIEAKLDRAWCGSDSYYFNGKKVEIGGTTYGKIRTMSDHTGKRLKEALPSQPVEITVYEVPPR